MKRTATLSLFVLFVASLMVQTHGAAAEEETEFKPLFDGKTLDGWRKVGGGATYRVEDECIIGKVGPGSNTFLRTEKTYGDFILKLQCKLDVPGNSGIQFRSHQRGGKGRVFGYQCEIDPSPRAWSAGIYDEGRRGWLYSLKNDEKARKAIKLDGWNDFVIQAIGPSLKTWLNGVPCANLIDTADLEGFIALQVHAGKKGQIRWRNIRIKDLGLSKWQKQFAGDNFDGWDKIGGGQWEIADGVVHGTSKRSEKRHGHLISKKTYSDFAVRLKFKSVKGNSGLYFRVEKKGFAGVSGFQAEIDPTKDVGGLYETSGRAWVVKPSAKEVKSWFKPGQWNDMTVVALGKDITVLVNGKKTAELKNDRGRTQGHIAMQLHGGSDMDVLFKDIEILMMPKTDRAQK